MRYRPYIRSLLVAAGIILAACCCTQPAPAQAPAQPGAKEAGSAAPKANAEAAAPAATTTAAKAESDEPPVEEVVRVDTSLVACDVLVLDKDGREVKGLGQADFVVTEDGQPQQIATFGLGDDLTRPRSIVLIIDYSGSMLPFINTSIQAAKTLVDKLNPDDTMSIVTDDVETLADFTKDKAKLKAKLESLRVKAVSGEKMGRSRQYSALMETLKKLAKKEELRPIIIFQTDGDELPALRGAEMEVPPPPGRPFGARDRRDYSMGDILKSAQKARVTLYSVIPGIKFMGLSPEERVERAKDSIERSYTVWAEIRPKMAERLRAVAEKSQNPERFQRAADWSVWTQTALEGVAKVTGGWSDFLEKPDEAADVYTRIFKDINQRYIIGYQPTNKARDGSLRNIHIEVRGHPDYVVWGRKSYYAPSR